MKESARYLSVAETAKLMRVALKKEFPATKFSVRSSSFAGGSAIRVGWVDGPTVKRVKEITRQFESGGFDAMIDLQFSYEHWLLPDGTTQVAYSPGTSGSMGMYDPIRTNRPHDDAELVHFGAKYVSETREISLDFARKLIAQVAAYSGREAPGLVDAGYRGYGCGTGGWKFADERLRYADIFGQEPGANRTGDWWSWHSCLHRAAEDATAFAREVTT